MNISPVTNLKLQIWTALVLVASHPGSVRASPIVTPKEAYNFWKPKVNRVLNDAREYWVPKINNDFLPTVHKATRSLDQKWGGSRTEKALLEWGRKEASDLRIALQEAKDDLARRIPFALKKAADLYVQFSLEQMRKPGFDIGQAHWVPGDVQILIGVLKAGTTPTQDPIFQDRLDHLLNRIRYFAADRKMRDCYRVVGLESTMSNAFNTGCTIMVTRGAAEKLNDDELLSVLAHEMSHGDEGHLVQNLGSVLAVTSDYALRLVAEDLVYLLTGFADQTLLRTTHEGTWSVLLATYGKKAPTMELEADTGGAKILCKAGIDPRTLQAALSKLIPVEEQNEPLESEKGLVREYPSFKKRIEAIEKARTTCNRL